jgi:hypothetical protein
MGECAYYLKAEFTTEHQAKKMLPRVQAFLIEASESYKALNYATAQIDRKSPSGQKKYREIYPTMSEYVNFIGGFKNLDHNQDFGQDTDEINSIDQEGNILSYQAGSVGHMTSWTSLCEFIKEKFGATRVVYGNEEGGCGSLDSLKLYEWEDIVKDILKQKEMLPNLLGINDELDILIEQKLKRKGK